MKRLAFAIFMAHLSLHAQAAGGSFADDPRFTPMGQVPSLESLMNPTSEAVTGVNSIRAQLLSEGGRTVGFRGGLTSRARELVVGLQHRARALDVQYEFASLISQAGVLPPVIVEARDVAAFTPDQIRTADRVYKIERQERFVSVPPSWRDYLLVGLPTNTDVELPIMEARPVDSAEMKVWQEAVQQGWKEGEEQAQAILEANFHRLTRDYAGMLLYSTLVQHDLIGQSTITEAQQTVTGTRQELTLGDRVRRIVGRAEFETDASKWKPTIKIGEIPKKVEVEVKPAPAVPAQLVAPQAKSIPAPAEKAISKGEDEKKSLLQPKPAENAIAPVIAAAPVKAATNTRPAVVQTPMPPRANTAQPVVAATPAAASTVVSKPAAVKAEPAKVTKAQPDKKAAPLPIWTAQAGSTLRETIQGWVSKAGWNVDWQAEGLDYPIRAPIRIEGTFEEAIQKIFSYYRAAERPFRVTGSRQQKLLKVMELTPPRKSA
ncbi:hypothetical protein B6S59_31230 [Pseudomonas sp. A46]|nr:type IV secretory system conjugative DNA transfer family protein [Pseudomonas sp. A46]OWJ89357.1 hypothetical protein B6S59_31230 [Pseudomonas sp. A46]